MTFETYVDNFARRIIQQAMLEATADYWNRRADQFEASAPRPGDFIGRESTPEVRAERERLRLLRVWGCRYKATQVPFDDFTELIDQVLGEQPMMREAA